MHCFWELTMWTDFFLNYILCEYSKILYWWSLFKLLIRVNVNEEQKFGDIDLNYSYLWTKSVMGYWIRIKRYPSLCLVDWVRYDIQKRIRKVSNLRHRNISIEITHPHRKLIISVHSFWYFPPRRTKVLSNNGSLLI